MSSTSTLIVTSPRRTLAISAALHAMLSIALAVVALNGASALLPVTLSLRSGGPGQFALVDLATAAAVVVAFAAVCQAIASATPSAARRRSQWYLELSQISGITVFLVAQVNGITEAGSLIACYAIAAGAVGLLWLQSRVAEEHRPAPWPYSFGAALAVVPWGIVALYQVVGLAVSTPAPPIVRVLTVVLLLLCAAQWWVERRWQLGLDTEGRVVVLRAVLSLALGLALLVLVIGLARPSALL